MILGFSVFLGVAFLVGGILILSLASYQFLFYPKVDIAWGFKTNWKSNERYVYYVSGLLFFGGILVYITVHLILAYFAGGEFFGFV